MRHEVFDGPEEAPRLAVVVTGGRLADPQADALMAWLHENRNARTGFARLEAREVAGLSPAEFIELVARRLP